jgi:hypothetical protein
MYLEFIGFVVFKIFASFGLCDHVHSFVAIVHIVACWLAMSEKTLLKSKILNSLSLINSLNYLCENPHSCRIIKSSVTKLIWKDSIIFVTTKMEILQVQGRLKWKDFIIINSSQGQKWNGVYLGNSYFHLQMTFMSRNQFSLSSSNLWKAWKIHSKNFFNIFFTPFQIHPFHFC